MQNVQFLASVDVLMLFKQVVGEFLIHTIFFHGICSCLCGKNPNYITREIHDRALQ